jgi:hypothetical protein
MKSDKADLVRSEWLDYLTSPVLEKSQNRGSILKRPRSELEIVGVTSDFKIFNKVRILSFVRA